MDINEKPKGITLVGNTRIPENLPPGTVIGTLFTEDEDFSQTHSYNITGIILL